MGQRKAKLYQGVPKKVSIKTFIRSYSRLQFTVFGFIWIQYICKFCLVFHLKDLDASRWSYSSFTERYVLFSVQIQQKNSYQISEMLLSHAVSRFVTDYHLE